MHEWETEEHFGFRAARVVEACIEMKVVAGEALKALADACSEQILLAASLVEASWDTAACAAGMIVAGANVKPGSGEAAELVPIRRPEKTGVRVEQRHSAAVFLRGLQNKKKWRVPQ